MRWVGEHENKPRSAKRPALARLCSFTTSKFAVLLFACFAASATGQCPFHMPACISKPNRHTLPPAAVPDPPSAVIVNAVSDSEIKVDFSPPSSDGGSHVSSYKVSGDVLSLAKPRASG